MTNPNQCETQMTDLRVMISRCSTNSQHGGLGQHPPNIACSYFRYSKTKAACLDFYGIPTSYGLFHTKSYIYIYIYIYQIYMNCKHIFCSLTFLDKPELTFLHTDCKTWNYYC